MSVSLVVFWPDRAAKEAIEYSPTRSIYLYIYIYEYYVQAFREPAGLLHKNQQVFIVMNPIDLNLEPPILAVSNARYH